MSNLVPRITAKDAFEKARSNRQREQEVILPNLVKLIDEKVSIAIKEGEYSATLTYEDDLSGGLLSKLNQIYEQNGGYKFKARTTKNSPGVTTIIVTYKLR